MNVVNFQDIYLSSIFNINPYIVDRQTLPGLFDTSTLNTSTNNDFIPIVNYENCYHKEDGIYFYHDLLPKGYTKGILKYFLDYLTTSHNYRVNKIMYTVSGVSKTFYVGKGFILDEDYNFLFLAAFRNHLFQEPMIITKRDVKIYITNAFITEYKKIYNLVNKQILQPFIESGCELSITTSELIKDAVYGNEFERLSNFETLEDKLSFIETFRNTILEYD